MLHFLTQLFRRPLCPSASSGRARLVLEPLEERLVLSWSSVPPSVIPVPTNAAVISLDSGGDAQGNAAISANEIDYYTFVPATSGSHRLSVLTPTSNLDSVLGVFDSQGRRVAYNDDISSINLDSQLTVQLTAGSRYYLGITNYVGTLGGTYTWQVDNLTASTTDDSYENNDTLSQAANLGTLTQQRTVSPLVLADSADWFSFTTTAAGTAATSVAITFQNSLGNLDLQLYNASGQVLQTSAGTGNSETISLSGLAAGTYFVRVWSSTGATNPSYSLQINPPTTTQTGSGGFSITLRISGMTASQQAIFQQAAARWAQVIVGDLPNATYNGIQVDDVLIDASGQAIDGSGGILGQAGPDTYRSGSRLPIHGTMQFDTADLASLESSGQLYSVILHEMGHVLGIGTIWAAKGLLAGAGTSNPRFTGAQATAAYNALFGTNATAVPVENSGGSGTRDSHWRESVFNNELMTGYLNAGSNPLSRVTIASLADLGYQVNLNAADSYVPPSAFVSNLASASGSSGASLVAEDARTWLPLKGATPIFVPWVGRKDGMTGLPSGTEGLVNGLEERRREVASPPSATTCDPVAVSDSYWGHLAFVEHLGRVDGQKGAETAIRESLETFLRRLSDDMEEHPLT